MAYLRAVSASSCYQSPYLRRAADLVSPMNCSAHDLQAANAGRMLATTGLAALGAGAVAFSSGEDHVEPASYTWSHSGPFSTFDASA